MSEKTYVFDNDGGGCNNGMMGLIASLCQNRGLDPNMVAALMNNNRGCGGWGDMGAWWIVILLIFGWGGWGGFGGGFNGRGSAQGLADLGNLVNNDAGRDLIMQAIQGNANAISQLASTVHCDTNQLAAAIQSVSSQICNLGNTLGLGQRDIIQQIMTGNQNIISQLCSCCCDLRASIADFKGDVALQMCQQTNTIQNSINTLSTGVERGFAATNYAFADQTCQLKQAIAEQTQVINDKFCALEMREMQRENQNLRDQVNQYRDSALAQQTATNVVQRINPAPIPAYWVPNVNGCGCNYYGYPFNNGNGCFGNNNNCGGGCGCC